MKKKTFSLDQNQRGELIKGLEECLRDEKEIAFAYLYGSFAEDLPFHDIDLGIYLLGVEQEDSTSYALALGQILSKKVKLPVDVRVLNYAPVLFAYHVLRGILVLDRDEELRVRVTEETIQKYLDLKPMIHRGIKEAFG